MDGHTGHTSHMHTYLHHHQAFSDQTLSSTTTTDSLLGHLDTRDFRNEYFHLFSNIIHDFVYTFPPRNKGRIHLFINSLFIIMTIFFVLTERDWWISWSTFQNVNLDSYIAYVGMISLNDINVLCIVTW